MGVEIERKFLLGSRPPDIGAYAARRLQQGYIPSSRDGTEVRVRAADEEFTLTVKSSGAETRVEVELPISASEFDALWPLTDGMRIEKLRTRYPIADLVAEIDIFEGALAPLELVEVEFQTEAAARAFDPPPWFAGEVTADRRYKNRYLALKGLPE